MTDRPKHPAFSETLPILLLRAKDAVTDRFRPVFIANGITEQQWRVLRVVSELGEMEMTPLAQSTFLGGPSLSRIVKDMAVRGLLRRQPGEKDQRKALVSITPAGVDLIRAVAPGAYAAMNEINRRYGEDRMERIRVLLIELEAELTNA